MAKFLNKKEQVIDFKITSYGRYLLSIGSFKPVYYAFFDNDVVYDARYKPGGPGARRPDQNKTEERIKDDTSYFETIPVFKDVEESIKSSEGEVYNYFDASATSTMVKPESDIFKFNSVIGDAFLDGKSDDAPSWQILMMQNKISSSFYKTDYSLDLPPPVVDGVPQDGYAPGVLVNSRTPQINIKANYTLKVAKPEFDFDVNSARDFVDQSDLFADNKVIQLEMNDPLLYFDELKTQLLTENFEVEVFEVLSNSVGDLYSPTLQRKYFERKIPQIENGFMMTETPLNNEEQNLTTASVEYYFDVLTDASVNQVAACAGAQVFSKKGYYINFDFDCETESGDAVFYDIYGSVTEPEICQT